MRRCLSPRAVEERRGLATAVRSRLRSANEGSLHMVTLCRAIYSEPALSC